MKMELRIGLLGIWRRSGVCVIRLRGVLHCGRARASRGPMNRNRRSVSTDAPRVPATEGKVHCEGGVGAVQVSRTARPTVCCDGGSIERGTSSSERNQGGV